MGIKNNTLDSVNRDTYANAKVVDCYGQLDFIHKPEKVILDRLNSSIQNTRLLDIGFGGGRTTRFLLEISKDYTGIDYTAASVEAAKLKYPSADLRCADARNLSQFEDESFDFVLFSFNGIDYMNHEDRLIAFGEMHRVLKPAAHLAFSTHNRGYRHFNKLPWEQGVQINLSFLKSCLYTLAYLPRHRRMRRLEIPGDGYDIINDNAHEFSLLTYYIGIDEQKKQLAAAGFEAIEAFDMEGRVVEREKDFPWTYYLARKSSGPSDD